LRDHYTKLKEISELESNIPAIQENANKKTKQDIESITNKS
jgi:hypothetical protein